MSGEELAAHCEAISESRESADGQYCIRYIQGFIDGAVATDERVMLNLEAEYARKESYSERQVAGMIIGLNGTPNFVWVTRYRFVKLSVANSFFVA